ncbi:MAG: hypothetical protein Q9157_006183, partial [Trypethelium eluteriae]
MEDGSVMSNNSNNPQIGPTLQDLLARFATDSAAASMDHRQYTATPFGPFIHRYQEETETTYERGEEAETSRANIFDLTLQSREQQQIPIEFGPLHSDHRNQSILGASGANPSQPFDMNYPLNRTAVASMPTFNLQGAPPLTLIDSNSSNRHGSLELTTMLYQPIGVESFMGGPSFENDSTFSTAYDSSWVTVSRTPPSRTMPHQWMREDYIVEDPASRTDDPFSTSHPSSWTTISQTPPPPPARASSQGDLLDTNASNIHSPLPCAPMGFNSALGQPAVEEFIIPPGPFDFAPNALDSNPHHPSGSALLQRETNNQPSKAFSAEGSDNKSYDDDDDDGNLNRPLELTSAVPRMKRQKFSPLAKSECEAH